ncbi:MAG: protein-disulfide reductase DsbD domain-containing protein [Candidatus Acidiferrales bacterium]
MNDEKSVIGRWSIQAAMEGRNRARCLAWAAALGAALFLCATPAQAAGTPIPHGTLELVAERQWIAAGHTVNLGLHFELEKGWHIYWVNPGDSGEPPRVKWELPVGTAAGAIEWPTPHRLGTPSIVDYGYEDSATLIVPMRVEASLKAQRNVEIGAEVKVLVCREMCIPGKAQLSLTLAVKPEAPPADSRSADWFAAARKALPRTAPDNWKFTVTDAKDSLLLNARLNSQITGAVFFPLTESQISNAAPQDFQAIPGGFRLTLRKSDQLLKPIDRLKGVLVLSDEHAYSIAVPVSKPGAAARTR